jgi:hypothetical protein
LLTLRLFQPGSCGLPLTFRFKISPPEHAAYNNTNRQNFNNSRHRGGTTLTGDLKGREVKLDFG